MPEADDIEKFLADQKSIDARKQALIDDVLRQRAEAMKAFDDKLEKLGYAGKPKKSHHKQPETKPKPAAKV